MMLTEIPYTSKVYELVELGGLPITAILCLSMLIFLLFFERLYYFLFSLKSSLSRAKAKSLALQNVSQWEKRCLQSALLADAKYSSQRSLWLLKAAIVACPLIGLMGTVSGMIIVFDQISMTGTGNPRLMASGIFQATLPTMAGMLVSIIGLVMQYILRRLDLHSNEILKTYFPSAQTSELEGASS
jgi:biopolymer transport protein ExbB